MIKIGLLFFILLMFFCGFSQEVVQHEKPEKAFQVDPTTFRAGKPNSIVYSAPKFLKPGDSFTSRVSVGNDSVLNHVQEPKIGIIQIDANSQDFSLPMGFDKFHFDSNIVHNTVTSQSRFIKAQPSRYKDNAVLDVKYYDVSQGLSNSYVLDIYQDRNGLLWFATNGGGVCRFDGEYFEVFNENGGLANNMVVSIAPDQNENFWFATMGGLTYYDYKSLTSYTKHSGLGSNYLTDVIVSKSGLVWIGTEDSGLKIFNGRQFYSVDSTLGMGNRITTLYEDYKGRIWVGTHGRGVFMFDQNHVCCIGINEGLLSNAVRDISGNASGKLAIAYNEGLDLIEGDTLFSYGVNQGLPPYFVNVVLVDDDGDVVMGTNGGGVYRLEHSMISSLNSNHGLNNDEVWTLLKDDSGVFWIGTWGGGVNRYDGFSFIHLSTAQGLPADLIPSMTRNSQGVNWFGTYGNGFFSMENSVLKHYGKQQGFSAFAVWSMIFDRSDKLWIGTGDNGLWWFDGKTFKVYNTKNGFPTDGVWSLCEDRKGSLWIGTNNMGVFRYDGSSFYRVGLTESAVVSLFEDSKGNIWVSTWGDGMYRIGRNEILHFHEETGFPAQKVYNVFEDNDGYIWIATNGDGLLVYNGEHFQRIDTRAGIGSDFNFWVEQLNDESLMIGTESGLTHFKLIESGSATYPEQDFVRYYRDSVNYRNLVVVDNRLYSIENYGIDDGFIGFDCIGSQFSMLKDPHDNLWIGTGKHLTRFNPTHQIKDYNAPKVHLKDISISLQPVDWKNFYCGESRNGKRGVRFDSLTGVYQIPVGLQLDYQNNHLTFDFIGINWKKPDKILYQYRLVNFDNKWNYPTRISMATYSNLPPGKYVFEVKAKNSDDIWSDPFKFAFEILTPWWQTIWFQLLFLFVVSTAVYLFIRWRILIIKRQKDNLERIVKERTKEILLQNEEIKSQRDHLNAINIELERMSIVASETLNGVLIADNRGNIDYINRGYTLLLGYTMEQLKQKKGPNLFFIYKNENTLHFIQKCRDERRSVTFSSQFERSDGEIVWLQVTVTPILKNNGEVHKYVVIYADITSLKKAQTQIENYNKEITASIRYASRIQTSMLPIHKEIKSDFIESFVIYQPQDIVGGDFYWFTEHNGSYLIGVIDCTGHGVPGALMTVISYAALNGIVNNETVKDPAKLLQLLNKEIRKMLRQQVGNEGVSDDGLDASFCYVTPNTGSVIFAGAMQSLFYISNSELVEVKGDRQSVGYIDSSETFRYQNHAITSAEKMIFYMASDGYKDMSVGADGHILGKKKFKEIIQGICHETMEEQHRFLEGLMYRSVAVNGQIDDITLLGFRLK